MSVVGDEKRSSKALACDTGTVADREEGFSSSRKLSMEASMVKRKDRER